MSHPTANAPHISRAAVFGARRFFFSGHGPQRSQDHKLPLQLPVAICHELMRETGKYREMSAVSGGRSRRNLLINSFKNRDELSPLPKPGIELL